MIIQLRDTDELRSYLDTRTADVILQCAEHSGFMFGYSIDGYYEVIVRGDKSVDARHIDCKKQVVRTLKGYTETEVERLFEKRGEKVLDGIIQDYANAHIREPQQEAQ